MRFEFDIAPSWACVNLRGGNKSQGKAIYARTLESLSLMVLSQRHANGWGTLGGRLYVEVSTYWADERGGDVDATVKCTLDALQKGKAVSNDKDFAKLVAWRRIDKKRPRIEVEIGRLEDA